MKYFELNKEEQKIAKEFDGKKFVSIRSIQKETEKY